MALPSEKGCPARSRCERGRSPPQRGGLFSPCWAFSSCPQDPFAYFSLCPAGPLAFACNFRRGVPCFLTSLLSDRLLPHRPLSLVRPRPRLLPPSTSWAE